MRGQRTLAGLALVLLAGLAAGGLWLLATTVTRSAAATLVFVLSTLVFAIVVGVRSRRWASSPYF
jgi:hypothetical protein